MRAYDVLNISDQADDKTIKAAYMCCIQTYSPDRHPEQFKKIRAAYEAIATADKRLAYQLFELEPVTVDDLYQALLSDLPSPLPLDVEAVQQYLAAYVKRGER